MSCDIRQRTEAIRSALMRGETDEQIAVSLGTTLQAVRVVRKGLGLAQTMGTINRPQTFVRQDLARRSSASTVRRAQAIHACPLHGRFASVDGANVAGWGQRRGEPRLAQTLALCRWFSDNGVRFVCWFDSNFRWAVRQFNPCHADVLEQILQREPGLFKMSPAGVTANGVPRKADPFVLQDALSIPGGLVVSNDLYRKEVESNPQGFGWLTQHPECRVTGQIAANDDILLGDDGHIRIPVNNDPRFYIR